LKLKGKFTLKNSSQKIIYKRVAEYLKIIYLNTDRLRGGIIKSKLANKQKRAE
jgi:hypothetical protein